MNVHCDFLANCLTCELPLHLMDMMLKVRVRMGEHTFREDMYMHTLKSGDGITNLDLFDL